MNLVNYIVIDLNIDSIPTGLGLLGRINDHSKKHMSRRLQFGKCEKNRIMKGGGKSFLLTK